jgi:hypothetical protein
MQANLNGYIQLPAVLDPGVDNFIVPSAHGNKAGMVRGALAVRGRREKGGGGVLGGGGGVGRISPKPQPPASTPLTPKPRWAR